MSPSAERFVPKVHPLARPAAEEDPLELIAAPVVGDPDVMLECLLQEFAWMGWDGEALLRLFLDPAYPVLNQLLAHHGEDVVRRRIQTLLSRSGVFQVRETISDDEPSVTDEPELIQLTFRLARE